MKNILRILAALAPAVLPATTSAQDALGPALIAPIETPPPVPGTATILPPNELARPIPGLSADQLLDQASTMLARYHSVVAKVRCRAQLFDREIIGNGEYLQGPGTSRLMRYELRLQTGNRVVHSLQVNDGRYLWRRYVYEDEPEIDRIDVNRALSSAMANGIVAGPEAVVVVGMGGLGRLIESLRKDFQFTSVFRSELGNGQVGGLPVYGVEGTWNPLVLSNLGLASAEKLRPHVPDRVTLYLGCDDAFLYRVDYSRTQSGAGEGGAAPKPLLKLELFEVQFDVPIDEARFHFDAAAHHVVDVTERYIQSRPNLP